MPARGRWWADGGTFEVSASDMSKLRLPNAPNATSADKLPPMHAARTGASSGVLPPFLAPMTDSRERGVAMFSFTGTKKDELAFEREETGK